MDAATGVLLMIGIPALIFLIFLYTVLRYLNPRKVLNLNNVINLKAEDIYS